MANLNAPYGLLPIQSAVGAPSNFEMISATIATNNATQIFRGDLVERLSTGFIQQWVPTHDVNILLGVFWGVTYLSSALSKVVQNNYWPGSDVASTAQGSVQAFIIPTAGTASPLFRIQSDATGVAFGNIYNNADVTVATAGSTLSGQSGMALNATSTIGTTLSLPLKIMGLYGNSGIGFGQWGTGGFGGIQPGTQGPYSGSATGPFNWVVVRANSFRELGV